MLPSSCSKKKKEKRKKRSEDANRDEHIREVLTATTKDLVEVFLPVIVKHLIGLIDDHEFQATERQVVRPIHKVNQSARGRNQDIATKSQLVHLVADGTATVDHAWTKHASVAKLAGFHENLNGQLAGGNDDTNQRLGAGDRVEARSVGNWVGARSRQLLRLSHELVQNGDQVRRGLARA